MNKRMIALLGVALLALAAGGIYRETHLGDRWRAPLPVSAPVQGGFVFAPHPAPKPLPDLQFEDGQGHRLTLASFRGKSILLNIWATWCPPCRKEMPTLDRLQSTLGSSRFEVVALSIDQDGSRVVPQFFKELDLKALRVYLDQTGEAATRLGAVGVPTTLFIDREGREVGRVTGPAEWDSPEVVAAIRRYLDLPMEAAEPGTPSSSSAEPPPVTGTGSTR